MDDEKTRILIVLIVLLTVAAASIGSIMRERKKDVLVMAVKSLEIDTQEKMTKVAVAMMQGELEHLKKRIQATPEESEKMQVMLADFGRHTYYMNQGWTREKPFIMDDRAFIRSVRKLLDEERNHQKD